MGVTQLATRLGMSKGGVHRVLKNLLARGIIEMTLDRKYRLTLALWELGLSIIARISIRSQALPYLELLVKESGENSYLTIYDSGQVIYLEKVSSNQPVVVAGPAVGARAPAYTVATGKAILAWKGEVELERVLDTGLQAFSPRTITDPESLRTELEAIRQQGFSLNRGEWREQVVGIGAPVRDHTDSVIAGISISGPATRLNVDTDVRLQQLVVECARNLSRELGFRDPTARNQAISRHRLAPVHSN
jgi:DNA-binding IclR family transcriptional regulator